MPKRPCQLSSTFDHCLGEGALSDAMRGWRPSNATERRVLLEELLTYSRGLANVLTGLAEHRAVTLDDRGSSVDICDPWDAFALSDLLGSLLELITTVSRQGD